MVTSNCNRSTATKRRRRFADRQVRLSAGTRQNLSMLAKPGRPQAPITFRVVDDDGEAFHEQTFADTDIPKALLATQSLIVQLGGSIGLEQIGKLYEVDHPEKVVAVDGDISTLPEDWLGYDGADVVVISTSDPQTYGNWSHDRVAALDHWVRMGGTLILCVGRKGASVLANDAPLARFAPGEFDSVVSRGPGAWESFAGALSEPMTARGGGRAQPIRTTMLKNVRGRDRAQRWQYSAGGTNGARIRNGDLRRGRSGPTAVHGVVGAGKLLLRLLQRQDPQAEETAARESASLSTRLGYTDLSGQLRSALDRFEGVGVVSFLVVALLGLGFLLLLFPLEYLLVRRGGRFGLTWITFPLLLAGTAAGIWWFAQRSKGDQVRVNRVDIVDVDLGSRDVRGSTFFGLYSPATRAYDVSIHPDEQLAKAGRTRASWLGLPGPGLGGMNSTVINPAQFDRPYRFGGDRIAGCAAGTMVEQIVSGNVGPWRTTSQLVI